MANQIRELFDDEVPIESSIVALHELVDGQEADFFALLAEKQILSTRDKKPYFRVTFRDAKREVSFPIWSDAPLAAECRDKWQAGQFFKLRATYRETSYGPQLDIAKIRLATDADCVDGFDPLMCLPRSRFDSEAMFDDIMTMARDTIENVALRDVVIGLYEQHREALLVWPAAKFNHHAFIGGYLEHVRNVTRHTIELARSYREIYDQLDPPIDVGVAVAGALLHDFGKLRELERTPAGAEYTTSGTLVGHVLQGRDMFIDAARDTDLDDETSLRVEHIILSHHRLAEWGAPKPPMTIEANIVHYADDLDAKLQMMVAALTEANGEGAFTSNRNPLRMAIYRGQTDNAAASDSE
jgi:3'-5' exoribonuclease